MDELKMRSILDTLLENVHIRELKVVNSEQFSILLHCKILENILIRMRHLDKRLVICILIGLFQGDFQMHPARNFGNKKYTM